MLQNLKLTIIDGTVCIASTITDFNQPRLLTSHWPTTVSARDLAGYFDVPQERLLAATVKESFPGEYYITNPGTENGADCHGMTGIYEGLTHGSKTQPIKTEIADYPAPKNRGKRVEYRDGYWFKEAVRGFKRHESI